MPVMRILGSSLELNNSVSLLNEYLPLTLIMLHVHIKKSNVFMDIFPAATCNLRSTN